MESETLIPTKNNTSIWTEKYRPKKFEGVVGQEDIIKKVQSFNLRKESNYSS